MADLLWSTLKEFCLVQACQKDKEKCCSCLGPSSTSVCISSAFITPKYTIPVTSGSPAQMRVADPELCASLCEPVLCFGLVFLFLPHRYLANLMLPCWKLASLTQGNLLCASRLVLMCWACAHRQAEQTGTYQGDTGCSGPVLYVLGCGEGVLKLFMRSEL